MKIKKERELKTVDLVKIENFLDYEKTVEVQDKTFEKLMFIYSMAIRELETKISIIKDEFKVFYDYELIDHINTRIKSPESIMKKMKKKCSEFTYRKMVEEINDIAGIRVICPLKKDIFSIKNLIEKMPGVNVLKEKDYITKPKKSGYSSYHLIVEVPITLSQNILYVKVEIQIRTMAMDFWASLEHKMRYKPEKEVDSKTAKELVSCAKMLNKVDNRMMLLNS